MANAGKFKDNLPQIWAAGIVGKKDESVANLLKKFDYEDQFDNLVAEKRKHIKGCITQSISRNISKKHFENIKDIISPPHKTKFENFYDKVYEEKYESRKTRPLASSRDCLSKPATISNENTTFGAITATNEPLYGLILPPKIPFQVIAESEAGHENYVLSHHRYFPSEQIDRKYNSPPFDKNSTYGMQSKTEPGGKLVRRALEDLWCPDYLCLMSSVQRNYLDRYKSKIGKPLRHNEITSSLPINYTFGVNTKSDTYGTEELIYNRSPCEHKIKLYDALAYLNKLRHSLKNRMSYDMEDMRLEAEEIDTEYAGEISITDLLCILKGHHLGVDEDKIRLLLRHFAMLKTDDKVDFKQFMNLLDTRHSIPDVGRLDDIYASVPHTLTTYRDFSNDMYKEDLKCSTVSAGVSPGTIRADIESLTEETNVRDLLVPSVPTIFGLSYRDYCLPRTCDEIRRIFTNVGYDLRNDCKFQELWCEASNHWTCCGEMVSVEAFRHVLKLHEENRKC